MSSSFPERASRAAIASGVLTALLAGSMILQTAQAAQTYWEPRIEASVEQSTNRNLALTEEDEADVTGYIVDAELTWGHVTPRSDTTLRPRLRFQNFPKREEIDSTEQFFDLRTSYQISERSTFSLFGRYRQEDAFDTELGDAGFDDFDPDDPIGDEQSGTTEEIGEDNRTLVQVRPAFRHEFSDLTGFELEGIARSVSFDSDFEDRTSYDYFELTSLITREFSPRTRLLVGPMVSRYETDDGVNTTDGYGLDLGLRTQWSEITTVTGRVFVRETDAEITNGATTTSESDTNFGFDVNVRRRTEVGSFQFSLGRNVRPTSSGKVVVEDEVRLQHDYSFSDRLSMRTALRGYIWDSTSGEVTATDREYARGEIGLTWMMTPTWYLQGGYSYTWRDIDEDPSSADNHTAYFSIGYRGLGRPR